MLDILFNKEKYKKDKEEKHKQIVLAKERERHHKELLAKQEQYRREDKVAPEGAFVSLKNINKIYDNHVQAVYDFNLDIKPQEFIVFVGPSGCGKSTTLRMIAGLEEITYGDLYIEGEYSNELPPKDRNIAMVFQSYALYPHYNVYDNIAFGLKMRHTNKQEIDERVRKAADILDLTDYLDRKPNALSGGQCQRVALGRAIVRNSKLFLMDEPLSNLDAKLRVQMRAEIIRLHKELGTTTIYVTHDQTEAMTMASRIVVMSKGYVQQIGTPKEIYDHPANEFVASFIGSPAMNIFDVTYDKGTLIFSNDFKLELSKEMKEKHDTFYKNYVLNLEKELEVINDELTKAKEYLSDKQNHKPVDKNSKYNDKYFIGFQELKLKETTELLEKYKNIGDKHVIRFGIRPEDIIRPEDVNKKVEYSKTFKTNIELSELLGREYYIHFNLGDDKLISKLQDAELINSNESIELGFNLKSIHLFDKDSSKIIF